MLLPSIGAIHIYLCPLDMNSLWLLVYAAGAGFYITRIPERWKPGAFDIAGHSHQIFLVLVVAGALAHSAAPLVVMDWRRGLPTCAVSESAFSWT
ncbi:hypothetical protein L1049_023161 [Liquidambar formosana]|uniref:Uncharacterized protein n=1 Tax=Liquidambar formosana TaxID=63359 RepID=A0AAP0WPK9_LIQFO